MAEIHSNLAVVLGPEGRAFFSVEDAEAVARLRSLFDELRGPEEPRGDPHGLISGILASFVAMAEGRQHTDEGRRSVLKRHVDYHRALVGARSSTPLHQLADGLILLQPERESLDVIEICVAELLAHGSAAFGSPIILRAPPTGITSHDEANPLFDVLPASVYALRTEAALHLVAPWFFRSLEVPGDVCEFGCFRGTMSIKFAYALRALRLDKMVYAFDTFEGFQIDDPSGGQLTAGTYADNDNAYEELTRWSSVIPVRAVKGDATETCQTLRRPLSFVWLDLDFAALMGPVLDTIWPLLGPDTVIGIDDIGRLDGAGRPVTPSVEPWVDDLVCRGRLIEVERHAGAFLGFYRKA